MPRNSLFHAVGDFIFLQGRLCNLVPLPASCSPQPYRFYPGEPAEDTMLRGGRTCHQHQACDFDGSSVHRLWILFTFPETARL